MAGLLFWDVDTQNDFMHADGKLYVPDAEQVIANLKRLSTHARQHAIRVVASADDHIAGDAELSDTPDFVQTFPAHCMRGTSGQRKIPETALHDPLAFDSVGRDPDEVRAAVRQHSGDILLLKNRVDVFSNPNVEPVLDELNPDDVVVYGVALDICTRYAVEGLLDRRPDTKLYVVTDATKPIDADKGRALLDAWAERGAELVTTADVLQFSTRRSEAEVPHRV